MCRPSILVVDNREDLVAATRDLLVPKGYEVMIATSEAEAIKVCQENVVHVAVIDVRLADDRDEDDWSGLHLAAALSPSIAKVILTGARYSEPDKLVRRVLGPDKEGRVLASEFLWKREGPNILLDAIRLALNTKVQLRETFLITYAKGITLRTFVDQLKIFRDQSDAEKQKAERVLEDLTCRLLSQSSGVHFLRDTPGHGPCTVALVQPFDEEASGAELAMKFGPAASIEREVQNYKKYVEFYAPINSTQLRVGPMYSRDLGAIGYQFVGRSVGDVADFNSYYRNESVSDDDVCNTIAHLFEESCVRWYRARRAPFAGNTKSVDEYYREQVNLVTTAQVDELRGAMAELLNKRQSGPISFQLLDDDTLQVRNENNVSIKLPNPVAFVFDHDSEVNRAWSSTPPSQIAITHGDLHSGNVLVDEDRHTWMIDFFMTGWGPVLRDFAELECDIKFNLLELDSLLARYEMEKMLLASTALNDSIELGRKPYPGQVRAIKAIQKLRDLACLLADTMDVREYYRGLLFFALKRIVGFTSATRQQTGDTIIRYHALLSAAMLCQKFVEEMKTMKSSGQVFFNYARLDAAKVLDVYQELSAAGLKPWMDSQNLLPGEQWELTIKRALEESDIVLVFLSKNSAERRGVLQKERRQAFDVYEGMLDTDIYIIPVRLEAVEMPYNLRNLQYVDLFKDGGLSRLLQAIRVGLERRNA